MRTGFVGDLSYYTTNTCGRRVDPWAVGGATVGGAFAGVYGFYAGAGAVAPLLTQLGLAGEIIWGVNGGALGIFGSLLDPKSPYTVGPANAVRAAKTRVCK